MRLTEPVDWIEQERLGYMVNAEFSEANKQRIQQLTSRIAENFDHGLFFTPRESLHITLLDWIAPLVDYDGRSKDSLYETIKQPYDEALEASLAGISPITVHFNEIHVSPSTIYIVGHDQGQFQVIRNAFMERVNLLPGTKLPPTIIHSSLARFTQQIDLNAVEALITEISIGLDQQVDNFRLVRSAKEPLLEFEVLKRYQLAAK